MKGAETRQPCPGAAGPGGGSGGRAAFSLAPGRARACPCPKAPPHEPGGEVSVWGRDGCPSPRRVSAAPPPGFPRPTGPLWAPRHRDGHGRLPGGLHLPACPAGRCAEHAGSAAASMFFPSRRRDAPSSSRGGVGPRTSCRSERLPRRPISTLMARVVAIERREAAGLHR